jgi:hypothetical protein
MALAGDAAHPMLPRWFTTSYLSQRSWQITDQAQGGAQGIEDGVALGLALKGATPEQVEERLDLYEKIRRNRASAVQILSNVGYEESHIVYEELKKYLVESDIPSKFIWSNHTRWDGNWRHEVNPGQGFSFMFGHNVEAAAMALEARNGEPETLSVEAKAVATLA